MVLPKFWFRYVRPRNFKSNKGGVALTDEKAERNDQIFHMRFERDMTFTAIGERLGLTRERVRQIYKRVKDKHDAENLRPTRNG